ncbi:MAG: glycosyltransferase family 2 protein [Flavobacterium sp.]
MPLFSVIVSLYNKEAYIKATLDSILAQGYQDYEVIITDDGSTDGSASIVKQFTDPRIKYYRKDNEGASAARNFGVKMAAGEYFAFLDADDIWYPDHLEAMVKCIAAMPHLKVFASLLKVQNRYGFYEPVYTNLTKAPLQEADFFKASFARTILSGSTTVMHRSAVNFIGDFDTSLKTAEDTDYWIRAGLTYKIGVINKITACHIYVPESLSHKGFSMAEATYFEKFREEESKNANVKKMIDINRHALALRCKMYGDTTSFKKLLPLIDADSLTPVQKIILRLPGTVLRWLQKITQYRNAKF